MSHLDLEGLQKYAQKERKWADNTFDSIENMNWQKTENDKVVQAYPLPEQLLEPKVSFMFKEVLPDGTKSPDNPSTVTGVSSIMIGRCGKNLCHPSSLAQYPGCNLDQYPNRLLVSQNDDGSYTFNGSAQSDHAYFCYFWNSGMKNYLWPDYLKKGSQYTFSMTGDDCSMRLAFYKYWTANFGGSMVDILPNQTKTYTMPETPAAIIRFQLSAGETLSNAKLYPQIEYGTEATEFEPYIGDEYVLSLGGTYYGGTYDMANGVIIKSWDAVTLTGQETWYRSDTSSTEDMSYFYTSANIPQQVMGNTLSTSTRCCTHFPILINGSTPDTYFTWGSVTRIIIRRPASQFPNIETFKNWLASEYANGTPVIIAYKLYTPQIAHISPVKILSLPQTNRLSPRLNTIYTDAQSVQVGYPKHPLRTQYELDNAILSLGGNE